MRAVIIGSDIASLIAAHAYWKSHPRGEMTLLSPGPVFPPIQNELVAAVVPELMALARVREVSVQPLGRASQWAEKVDRPDRTAEHFPNDVDTYRAHSAEDLWNSIYRLARHAINGWDPMAWPMAKVVDDLQPSLVVNTAPREMFCTRPDDHGFTRRQVWLSSEIGPPVAEDTVVLNAEATPAWYAASRIGGHRVTKWLVKPPFDTVAEDSEPMFTNCDCAPHGMVHVGREATFNPLATLVDVYSDTAAAAIALRSR